MLDEHVLDVLLAAGKLGDGEIGRARYDAGTSLRALYAATGLEPHVVAAGIAGRGGLSEESDRQAAALMSYTHLFRRLRVHAAVLRRTCIEGLMPDRLDRLVMALDALARDQDRPRAQREAINEFLHKRRIER